MHHDRPQVHRTLWIVVAASLFAAAAPLAAQTAAGGSRRILTCIDKQGRRLATDPADPRCHAPPKTPDEEAAADTRRRKALEAYQKCKAEERSDSILLGRYPNAEKHDAARRQALDGIESTIRRTEVRLEQLLKEHKHLLDEAEFYPKGDLPPKLRRDLDNNTALIDSQRAAIASQKDAAALRNRFYDEQRAVLERLWNPRGERRRCIPPSD